MAARRRRGRRRLCCGLVQHARRVRRLPHPPQRTRHAVGGRGRHDAGDRRHQGRGAGLRHHLQPDASASRASSTPLNSPCRPTRSIWAQLVLLVSSDRRCHRRGQPVRLLRVLLRGVRHVPAPQIPLGLPLRRRRVWPPRSRCSLGTSNERPHTSSSANYTTAVDRRRPGCRCVAGGLRRGARPTASPARSSSASRWPSPSAPDGTYYAFMASVLLLGVLVPCACSVCAVATASAGLPRSCPSPSPPSRLLSIYLNRGSPSARKPSPPSLNASHSESTVYSGTARHAVPAGCPILAGPPSARGQAHVVRAVCVVGGDRSLQHHHDPLPRRGLGHRLARAVRPDHCASR